MPSDDAIQEAIDLLHCGDHEMLRQKKIDLEYLLDAVKCRLRCLTQETSCKP